MIIIITITTTMSVLRQILSPFQGEFSTVCHLVLSHAIYTAFSFP